MKYISSVLLFPLIISCSPESKKEEVRKVEEAPYEIIMTVEHDPKAFTQGIAIHEGIVYESTGGEDSWIATVEVDRGIYDRKVTLNPNYFGEGITILNNKVYQLTWKSGTGFIYDLESFEELGRFTYEFEGWGITTDGTDLIISDGTDKLHFMDTASFEIKKTIPIRKKGSKVNRLNELEFINGYVYANQWETNNIIKIDLNKDAVVQEINFDQLVQSIKRESEEANVLNGIGYDAATGHVLITGKLWPKSYVIKLRN